VTTVNIGDRYVAFVEGGARTWVAGGSPPPPTEIYQAILALGESNSSGEAQTSLLSPDLLVPYSGVQILIPPNSRGYPGAGTFEPLHLGVNNALAHSGLGPEYHGIAAGFKPYLDANPAVRRPVYYIEAGQGGSTLSEWDPGDPYHSSMLTRVQMAKDHFAANGITVAWKIFFSIGINDFLASSPITPAEYQAGMIQLIAEARSAIGVGTAAKVLSPMFMDNWRSPFAAQAYTDLHEALPGLVTNFELLPTNTLPTGDPNHWSGPSYQTMGGMVLAAPT
jgi:hypothetical protein